MALAVAALMPPGPAATQEPMSAIDWLGRDVAPGNLPGNITVARPIAPAPSDTRPPVLLDEPGVAKAVITPKVTTTALDAPQIGSVGLLPRSVSGLPATLWQRSQHTGLARMLARLDTVNHPAMQSILYTLMLTEADPPGDDLNGLEFLLTRIDTLTELGAVEPALALADRADPTADPALFGKWFDLALLSGDENRACQSMTDRPSLAPSDTALSYCRARLGDWTTAALTFDSAAALGTLPAPEERLMRLFLDADMAEEAAPLPPPARITPLTFRLSEAIGQPLPTASYPRAYAYSDLRGISGWRAEIEAAERLARTGALSENRLLGIYTARDPAASGGIWDRVDLIQRLDAAIEAKDRAAVAAVLPQAWTAIAKARLELPFARLWGETLAKMDLSGDAARTAFDIALLSPDYETLARDLTPVSARDRFLLALAGGTPGDATAPNARATAITRGFAPETDVPGTLRLNLAQNQLGEAILSAMALYISGVDGETKDIAPALATFRAVGLEDAARRAALQLMILDRRS